MPVIQSQSAVSGKAETFTYVDFDRSGIGVLQLLAMLAPRRHQVRVGLASQAAAGFSGLPK
jgi:hypothetical protein